MQRTTFDLACRTLNFLPYLVSYLEEIAPARDHRWLTWPAWLPREPAIVGSVLATLNLALIIAHIFAKKDL